MLFTGPEKQNLILLLSGPDKQKLILLLTGPEKQNLILLLTGPDKQNLILLLTGPEKQNLILLLTGSGKQISYTVTYWFRHTSTRSLDGPHRQTVIITSFSSGVERNMVTYQSRYSSGHSNQTSQKQKLFWWLTESCSLVIIVL